MYISVIGAGHCLPETAKIAYEVGRHIAQKQAILVCGGLGGVMSAAAQGAKENGGITVGILPGTDRTGASEYLSIVLPTGLGYARNALVVQAADAVIAVSGEYGTLSEIGLALKMGKPVIGLQTWELGKQDQRVADIVVAKTPEEAVEKALELRTRRA
jgi:uncharacterized protein (TIGR00725 family)